MNTTELLSIIVKGMSKEGIELTNVEIYEEAIDINNKVKVCIGNRWFLVCRINKGGSFTYYSTDGMLDNVLELLKPTISKGDYVTDGIVTGMLIHVVVGQYYIIDLEDGETYYTYTKSLEELEYEGWRKA